MYFGNPAIYISKIRIICPWWGNLSLTGEFSLKISIMENIPNSWRCHDVKRSSVE